MVETPFTAGMFVYSSLFILLPLLWLQMPLLVYAVICAAIAVLVMALYFRRRIGGYTGDCLGATQQLAEIVIYLAVLGLWNSQ
jgi:adenosylcobinamide-GDP ribazoletransferase